MKIVHVLGKLILTKGITTKHLRAKQQSREALLTLYNICVIIINTYVLIIARKLI